MKILKIFLFIFFVCIPIIAFAQTESTSETFEAKVLEIIDQQEKQRENGSKYTQQDIKLIATSGSMKGKEIFYYGISEIDVLGLSQTIYHKGDKVIVNKTVDYEGDDEFYIISKVRRNYIYILGVIFSVLIIIIGRKKGVRSLFSLILSFLIITKFIIPQIINGANPLVIAIIGGILILGSTIYITEGINKRTHLALLCIFISLLITFVISYLFVYLTALTGLNSEESSFLIGNTGVNIVDFKGLLLAGILIGTLGVLDDVILGQIESVHQMRKINPNLPNNRIYKSAMEIGRTHLSSMVNTLFLTYAGASLPLLILFTISPEIGLNFRNLIDNEAISTEIIRTLAGSIGLIMAFPITSYLASYLIKSE